LGAIALVEALFYTLWSVPELIQWDDRRESLFKTLGRAFSLKKPR
jgi:hypothetical protein